MQTAPRRLVLAGAGHAHLSILDDCEQFKEAGFEVAVVGPSSYHYYSGMGPGMLSGRYTPEMVRFDVLEMTTARGGQFYAEKVARIHPTNGKSTITSPDEGDDDAGGFLELASGLKVPYDILSCNLGSLSPPLPGYDDFGDGEKGPWCYTVKPIENLLAAREKIIQLCEKGAPPRIVVAGGGPAGVEIAGNAWAVLNEAAQSFPELTMVAGGQLLGQLGDRPRRLTMESFAERGINIIEGKRAQAIVAAGVQLDDGTVLEADICLLALGVRPSPLMRASGLPVAEDGGMLVNRHLQSVAHPTILGGGDCISMADFPLARVGVHAVRENPILRHNVMALRTGAALKPYAPDNTYLLLLNLGDGTAVLSRWGLSDRGARWMRLKDWIDTRFMRAHQLD